MTSTQSYEAQIQQVLSTVRNRLDMDVGFVSEFVDKNRVFRFTDPTGEACPIKPGGSDPLENSYCHYIAQNQMPRLMADAAEDPIASRMTVTKELPVGAHLSVPIRLRDGRIFGTLCCFSSQPDPSLGEQDLELLSVCGDILARIIDEMSQQRTEQETRRRTISETLRLRAVTMLYQPIYRLIDDRLIGVEALARFKSEPYRSPETWFAEAEAVGLATDLEFLAVEEALIALLALPRRFVALNLSPAAILSARLSETFEAMPLDRVVIELTEHAAIENYAMIGEVLGPLRARGLRLAIDDFGAGHASFRHVLELKPNLIKLDMSLTRDIDSHPSKRAFAEAIARFSREVGCEIVAEGVETQAEMASLREIGVGNVQGHLTGQPMALRDAVDLQRDNLASGRGRKAAPMPARN